jgi:hypothetical protein
MMARHESDFDWRRDEMTRKVDQLTRHRRARNGAGAVPAPRLVLMATSGTVRVVLASKQLPENAAYCYEEASMSSHVQQVGDPSAWGEDRVARAIDLCGSVWRAGFLGDDGSTRPPNDGRMHPIPNVFVCQNRDGTLAVFPADGEPPTSAELGLVPVP